MHCSRRLIVQTVVFSHSYLHRQVSPPETLVVKGGSTWARNGRRILSENARLPHNIQESFTCCKSTTWDKQLYFPSEGRRAEDFFALKNPTASAGFEPVTWVPKASTLPLDHRSRTQFCLSTDYLHINVWHITTTLICSLPKQYHSKIHHKASKYTVFLIFLLFTLL